MWQTHLHPSFQALSPAQTGRERDMGAGKEARSPEITMSVWYNISPWLSSFTHISKNYLYGLDFKGLCVTGRDDVCPPAQGQTHPHPVLPRGPAPFPL